ncbi:MAG: RluA family pseudouridine synthase [Roseburia sp.]|nr:RluA family pseudouridine synthase [Roseburia sp.]
MEEFCLQITEEMGDERIDKCVSAFMAEKLSRSHIQKLIKEEKLLVNGKPVKVSYRVNAEDEISFTVPEPIEPDIAAEDIPLDILYEDEHLLVVNKPKGMVVHPAPGHYEGTLVNALLFHCKGQLSGINGVLRPGIVHRIDKDTSGSLVVCKNDFAHSRLAEQFKEHSITRKYYCICQGRLQEDGTVDKPIGRHPQDRKKMCVVTGAQSGRRAVTHYHVLECFSGYTYAECCLETGRTHQIRVHMAGIGHPILGDMVYGKQDYKGLGQILHAKTLGFVHPVTGSYLEVDAPLPDYFEKCLESLMR